jgi:hypothetical protein
MFVAAGERVRAVIASVVARASALGLCAPFPNPIANLAQREGWIALPIVGSLERLGSADPPPVR